MARDNPGYAEAPELALDGISVRVPEGWDCRIRRGSQDIPESAVFPVLHASTTAIPADRADYGGGIVEKLRDVDVFISLIEFGDEAVGSNLYPEVGAIPLVSPDMFNPFQLQRRIRGQAGTQSFFSINGRAFCLYVVVGSYGRRVGLAKLANELIANLEIQAR